MPADDLTYTVEIWDGENLEKVVARAAEPVIAWAAYNAAAEQYGARRVVMLCLKSHVMARSDRGRQT